MTTPSWQGGFAIFVVGSTHNGHCLELCLVIDAVKSRGKTTKLVAIQKDTLCRHLFLKYNFASALGFLCSFSGVHHTILVGTLKHNQWLVYNLCMQVLLECSWILRLDFNSCNWAGVSWGTLKVLDGLGYMDWLSQSVLNGSPEGVFL